VKCPQTWAWYTGFVHDYNESDKKLYIRYPNDWKKPEWMDIASVRHKYTPSPLDATWAPTEGEEVECKARAEEHEPYGWWPCKARRYDDSRSAAMRNSLRRARPSSPAGDDLYSVQFIGWGAQHNEILGRDFLRRKSRAALLSARNVTKKRYDVPPSLREWVSTRCQQRTILETLMPHKNIASQIIHISFAESTDKLVLIGGKRVLVTMQDIIYCFFEKQKSLLAMERRTQEMERRRDERKQAELAAEKTTFNIHPLLSGYLRGRKNVNIDRVQQMQNVIRVEPGFSTCYVAAKTKGALRDAVDALNIVCRKVVIPNEEMGQIIGFQGKQIQDIKANSKVIKVISWNKWKEEFATLKRIQMSRGRDRGFGRESDRYAEEGGDFDASSPRGAMGLGMTADSMKACDMDNIFGAGEVIDLTIGFESENAPFSDDDEQGRSGKPPKTDALVIIGRKSRVEICIFMLEMSLQHFRSITRARNEERRLRREINRLKGTSYNGRDYGRGGRGRGRRGGRGGRGRDGRDRRYQRGGDRDRRRDGDRRRNDRDRPERDRRGRDQKNEDDQKDGSQQSSDRRERGGRNDRDRRRNDRGGDRGDRNGQAQRDGGGGGGGGQRERYRKKEQQGQGQGQGQHDEKAEALAGQGQGTQGHGAPQRDVREVEAQRERSRQGQDQDREQGSSEREQRRGKRKRGGRKRRGANGSGAPQKETGAAPQQQQQPSE